MSSSPGSVGTFPAWFELVARFFALCETWTDRGNSNSIFDIFLVVSYQANMIPRRESFESAHWNRGCVESLAFQIWVLSLCLKMAL